MVVNDVGDGDGGCAGNDGSDVAIAGDSDGLLGVVWSVVCMETEVVVAVSEFWSFSGSV
jgi:hypothetical protein